jgi:6-pyruvoyltetrahydropterin/6-carboxytetrahydropterin synthase
MYRLCLQREFTASHRLIGGDWGAENAQHSHPYRVEWELRADSLDAHGFLIDLLDIEHALDEVVDGCAGRSLNEMPDFHGQNPSLERFVRILWERLSAGLPAGVSCAVRLWESPSAWAGFEEPPLPPR